MAELKAFIFGKEMFSPEYQKVAWLSPALRMVKDMYKLLRVVEPSSLKASKKRLGKHL